MNFSWNPFRKKSGLLRVMHAQSKKNRVVSKHGRVNTITRAQWAKIGGYIFHFFKSILEKTRSENL